MVFNTHFVRTKQHRFETPVGVSATVPDQSLTVQQILNQHIRGNSVSIGKMEIWDGEDDPLEGRDLRSLDLAELHDLTTSLSAKVQTIRGNAAAAKAQADKLAYEKHLADTAISEYLKTKNEKTPKPETV